MELAFGGALTLGVKGENSQSSGISMGVERIDEHHVRLTTGPTRALSSTMSLGLGLEVGDFEAGASLSRSRAPSISASGWLVRRRITTAAVTDPILSTASRKGP